MITVELFGVPRLRAGVARVALEVKTLGEALNGLGSACPGLKESVLRGGGLHPAYRLSLNSDRFVSDPELPLADGDTLLLLAADVGG
jgi:molybdopterin converting factor small subunit